MIGKTYAILSGWPSPTDSEVKRKDPELEMLPILSYFVGCSYWYRKIDNRKTWKICREMFVSLSAIEVVLC